MFYIFQNVVLVILKVPLNEPLNVIVAKQYTHSGVFPCPKAFYVIYIYFNSFQNEKQPVYFFNLGQHCLFMFLIGHSLNKKNDKDSGQTMKILELFSGTQSVSNVFRKNGWDTYTLDNDPYFQDITDNTKNIMEVTPEDILQQFGQPQVIWASPPCTAFSVASIGHHWKLENKTHFPKTEKAEFSQNLVKQAIHFIEQLQPQYWFIENPRGILRKLPFMQDFKRYTVTYCQYGDDRMKPTDIWTNHPQPNFKPCCKNGDTCHVSAPRGARTGTQGMKNAREKAKIPNELCEHIFQLVKK